MKLSELNPKLAGTLDDGMLRFDCPLGHGHKLRVPVGTATAEGRKPWTASGEFPDTLTLTPSILAHSGELPKAEDGVEPCGWHGFVTKGEVTNA